MRIGVQAKVGEYPALKTYLPRTGGNDKQQTLELGPVILDLYRAILSDPVGPTLGKVPDDLAIRWPAILTPTLQDQVNNYAQVAGADVGYVNAGVLKSEQVAISRSKQKNTLFPSVDVEALEEALELDAEMDVVSTPPPFPPAQGPAEGPSEPSSEDPNAPDDDEEEASP